MRPIKFRAIIKYQYEPMDNFPVTETFIAFFELKDISESPFGIRDIDDLSGCEILEVTYNQFTGLHDKNGKEIYEGDIVNYGFLVGKVFWHQCSFKVDTKKSIENLHNRSGEFIEVIGNIYENPELIE